MGLFDFNLGDVIRGAGEVADELFTSDEERLKLALEGQKIEASLLKGQMEINKTEAQHKSIFVAGWRPAIGWIGAAALAYQFVVYPFLIWLWAILQARGLVPAELTPPPVLEAGPLFAIITGMLGIGAMRSIDKRGGVQTDRIWKK